MLASNKSRFLYFLITTNPFFIVFFVAINAIASPTINSIIVNNQSISNYEIKQRLLLSTKINKITTKQSLEQKQDQLINSLIEEELIRQNAHKLNITASDEEVRNFIAQTAGKQHKTVQQWQQHLSKNNIDLAIYHKYMQSQILWFKIIEQRIKPKIQVSNLEMQEMLEQNKANKFITKFLLAEIVIANNHQNQSVFMQNLYQQLMSGANFVTLVKQFSIDESAKKNGLIGWFSQDDLNKKIYNSIENLQINDYSLPLQIGDNWYIFKIINKKSENKINDNQYNLLESAIMQQKINNIAKSYLQNLKNISVIESITN
jgi:peptidyl-prolyl cis-trans isomerase SurA